MKKQFWKECKWIVKVLIASIMITTCTACGKEDNAETPNIDEEGKVDEDTTNANLNEQTTLLYTVTEEGEAVITGGSIGETEIVIPAVIEDYPVAGIEADAFRNRNIKTVVLQQGIRYIKE